MSPWSNFLEYIKENINSMFRACLTNRLFRKISIIRLHKIYYKKYSALKMFLVKFLVKSLPENRFVSYVKQNLNLYISIKSHFKHNISTLFVEKIQILLYGKNCMLDYIFTVNINCKSSRISYNTHVFH